MFTSRGSNHWPGQGTTDAEDDISITDKWPPDLLLCSSHWINSDIFCRNNCIRHPWCITLITSSISFREKPEHLRRHKERFSSVFFNHLSHIDAINDPRQPAKPTESTLDGGSLQDTRMDIELSAFNTETIGYGVERLEPPPLRRRSPMCIMGLEQVLHASLLGAMDGLLYCIVVCSLMNFGRGAFLGALLNLYGFGYVYLPNWIRQRFSKRRTSHFLSRCPQRWQWQ